MTNPHLGGQGIKGCYLVDYRGDCYGTIQGDTRSVDDGSDQGKRKRCGFKAQVSVCHDTGNPKP